MEIRELLMQGIGVLVVVVEIHGTKGMEKYVTNITVAGVPRGTIVNLNINVLYVGNGSMEPIIVGKLQVMNANNGLIVRLERLVATMCDIGIMTSIMIMILERIEDRTGTERKKLLNQLCS